MGSFSGHIDEAIIFLLIAIWWMYKAFSGHILSSWAGKKYTCRLSYTSTICGRNVPVESIFKTLFPLVAGIAELSFNPIHRDGEITNYEVGTLLHVSLFAIFTIHGVIDILCHAGVSFFPGIDYLSSAMCFVWFGISFGSHANMPGREGMDHIIHSLPIYLMNLIAVSAVIEVWNPKCFLAQVSRIYGLLVFGTFWVHMSFILYTPSLSHGADPNPNWDRKDMRNASAVMVLMGLHLCIHMVTIPVVYMSTLCLLRARGKHREKYVPLLTTHQEGCSDTSEQKYGLNEDDNL